MTPALRVMRGSTPESVLTRTTKADVMSTFRQQLGECEAELVSRIVKRRTGRINPDRAVSLLERHGDPSLAGWHDL